MTVTRDEILHDVRLLDRHLRNGLFTRKDLEKHLKELPDVTDQAEVLALGQDNDIVVRGAVPPAGSGASLDTGVNPDDVSSSGSSAFTPTSTL